MLPGMKIKIEQALDKLEDELVSSKPHQIDKKDGINQT